LAVFLEAKPTLTCGYRRSDRVTADYKSAALPVAPRRRQRRYYRAARVRAASERPDSTRSADISRRPPAPRPRGDPPSCVVLAAGRCPRPWHVAAGAWRSQSGLGPRPAAEALGPQGWRRLTRRAAAAPATARWRSPLGRVAVAPRRRVHRDSDLPIAVLRAGAGEGHVAVQRPMFSGPCFCRDAARIADMTCRWTQTVAKAAKRPAQPSKSRMALHSPSIPSWARSS
jgi:hypothetical protein